MSCPLARSRRAHRRQSAVLRRGLVTWPQLLAVVRALDVAGEEPEGPLWLVVPFIKQLRALSIRLAGSAQPSPLKPLQLTLHAGEDFRHLFSGLRAVHEPYLWGLMQPGDRLGHALALGVDVERWFASNV